MPARNAVSLPEAMARTKPQLSHSHRPACLRREEPAFQNCTATGNQAEKAGVWVRQSRSALAFPEERREYAACLEIHHHCHCTERVVQSPGQATPVAERLHNCLREEGYEEVLSALLPVSQAAARNKARVLENELSTWRAAFLLAYMLVCPSCLQSNLGFSWEKGVVRDTCFCRQGEGECLLSTACPQLKI